MPVAAVRIRPGKNARWCRLRCILHLRLLRDIQLLSGSRWRRRILCCTCCLELFCAGSDKNLLAIWTVQLLSGMFFQNSYLFTAKRTFYDYTHCIPPIVFVSQYFSYKLRYEKVFIANYKIYQCTSDVTSRGTLRIT